MSGYEQAQRFLATSPRPKLRRHRDLDPGAQAVRTVVHVTEDPARGLALVRGRNVKAVMDVAGVLELAEWSVAAKGYVVPMSALPDVAAAAQHLNAPYRAKRVRGDA